MRRKMYGKATGNSLFTYLLFIFLIPSAALTLCIASSGEISHELLAKNLEGSKRGLICGTSPAFVDRDQGKRCFGTWSA
jgi:hypothetical protein